MLAITNEDALSFTKRVKLVSKRDNQNSYELQKSDVSALSNTITSLQNAFNILVATSTNSIKIEKLQQSKNASAVKEDSMEASVPAPRLGGSGDSSQIVEMLSKAMPHLSKGIDTLADQLSNLDLSKSTESSVIDIPTARSGTLNKVGTYAAAAAGTAALGVVGYSMLAPSNDEPEETESIQEPPKVAVAPKTSQPVIDKNERVQTKLVESARKAAGPAGLSVARAQPTSAPKNTAAKSWTERLSSFIGSTVKNVTDYVSALPEKLASLAGSVGGAISSFGSGVAETIGDITTAVSSGGGAADMEQAIERAGIKDPVIKAQIMAQAAHESMNFKTTTEIGNENYFRRYDGRRDLGNVQPGDGPRYRGRGFIQTTGRANYAEVSKALGVDFVNNPELLAKPEYAAASAMVWFKKRWGKFKDWGNTRAVTKIVNGGYTGLAEREANFAKYLKMYQSGGSASAGIAGAVQGARQSIGRGTQAVRETASTFVDNVKDVAGSFLNFFTLQPSVDMNGVKPPVVKRLKAMGAEYKQKTGKKLVITSAFRSYEKQAQLYARWKAGKGNLAAPPGRSLHEKGLAIDINPSQVDQLIGMGMLSKYGFHRPMDRRDEKQHIEPIEGARLASIPDNPYTPGNPIATAGKGSQPVSLGGKDSGRPIPKSKSLSAAASNVAVQQKVKGNKTSTTIIVAGNSTPPGNRTVQHFTGKASVPSKSNKNNSSSYLAYFGIG